MELIIPGFISGFISSLFCHPLEYLKVKYQSNNGNNVSNFKRGIIINPLVYGLHYSIYFPVYHSINGSNSTINPFGSACVAQGISNIILNPLWIYRTRLLVFGNNTELKPSNYFKLSGYTRSIIPNTILSLQTGISFGLMEILINNYQIDPTLSSLISKTIAGVITYPVDTFRTITRVNNVPLKELYYSIQFKNTYRGISFYLLKSVPSFVIMNYIFNKIIIINNNSN